ncbi:aminoglycoside phosphotransferase family protein [Arthrobacter glacialis]|uniref:Aminoglycoside resistance protein n=1 Tax=Arthrobacter glacialis TaxID=1664 RepID=A0A2S3ZUC9_ARTGL|nr:aminoglycoside phosphotransferase family protein [Arthrobacter glacialis]POH72704.1 aminoglycoside resistance protein [Arthrobacter glacialis]
MSVVIPEPLQLRHRGSHEGRLWLRNLPGFIRQALEQWELRVDVPLGALPWHGHTGVVIPVLTHAGGTAALKVAFPYEEALLEPVALKLWDGHGTVRVLASDEALGAILMERLDVNRSLLELPMDEAVATWGGLVKALSIRPDARPQWPQIPAIAATAERYCDELPQRWADLSEPFPRWLLEAALEVCQIRGVVGRRSSNDVLVHTDLHYLNVLARLDGNEYLAIDPQAQLGDAEFAVAPCLWNRLRDLPARNPEAGLRRRASQLANAAGLDEELAVQWSVVREVENALCYVEESAHDDAQRSLWVASTLAGRTLPGLPEAQQLKVLY